MRRLVLGLLRPFAFAAVFRFRLYAEGVRTMLGVPHDDGPDPVIGIRLTMGAAASFTGLGLEL